MSKIKEGDPVPLFSLMDQEGKMVDIKELVGRKLLVIFFYPADFSTICTMEARGFREMYEEFQRQGAEVFGISSDSVESHRQFALEHELQFKLLSDPDNQVREMFGAFGPGGTPARVTYVIDKEGKVRMVYSAMLKGKKHAEEAVRVMKELNA